MFASSIWLFDKAYVLSYVWTILASIIGCIKIRISIVGSKDEKVVEEIIRLFDKSGWKFSSLIFKTCIFLN